MIYSELILEGTALLSDADITEAALDARLLLEYICHTDRNTLYAHPDLVVEDNKATEYRELIKKRASHVPLQHLTGSQNFMGLDFLVTKDVLVPRQDTEFLVEEAMKYLQDGMRVLDLCTGSGCILISLMHYKNNIEGLGVDISEPALSIAKKNAERLLANNKPNAPVFLLGDLYEALNGADVQSSIPSKFDIIVSNPPYIRPSVIKTLMPEVKNHEPMLALDGGEDGLDFYRRIADGAKDYLTNYGRIFLEIGYDQGEEVVDILENAGFTEVSCLKDYANNPRVVIGKFIK